MGVFRQLGDPAAAAACLCQHHGVAYAEFTTLESQATYNLPRLSFARDTVITNVSITITETCCVIVNAALATITSTSPVDFEIERPLGTIRTQQEDVVPMCAVRMMHHASWEVLAPGVYTYYLVNRAGGARNINGAWIKAIASDCEG